MNKVSFDGLAIEVTRRCNMIPPCQHCFRGMPQAIDVEIKAVDNLLDQTSGIGDLTFSGGEPLVNLPAIKHIIQYIRDHRITVEYISIVTNGLIYSDEFSNLMIEADDYIREIKANHSSAPNITIGVSRDQYHNNNEGRHFVEKCAEAFKGRNVFIIPQLGGGYPYRTSSPTVRTRRESSGPLSGRSFPRCRRRRVRSLPTRR